MTRHGAAVDELGTGRQQVDLDEDDSAGITLELPLGLQPPRLANPALGLTTLSFGGAYVEVTSVIDVSDARLLRSGAELLLARGREGSQPVWRSRMPDWLGGQVAQVPAADGFGTEPPAELAAQLIPLVRTGSLGEVATLSVKRAVWTMRGPGGDTVASLTDDTVTLRRGEVAVARYREVTIVPSGCSPEAVTWLIDVLEASGATMLAEPVPLAVRLGAPATGMPDLPEPEPVDDGDLVLALFTSMVRRHARDLIRADRSIRDGGSGAGVAIRSALAALTADLRAFGSFLHEDVVAKLAADLAWLDDQAAEALHLSMLSRRLRDVSTSDTLAGTVDSLDALRRSTHRTLTQALGQPRYRRLLDTLVQFARSPGLLLRLGDDEAASAARAGDWLRERWRDDLRQLHRALRETSEADGEQRLESWDRVRDRAAMCAVGIDAVELVFGKTGRQVRKRLGPIITRIEAIDEVAHAVADLRGIALRGSAPDPAVVFALGQASALAATEGSVLIASVLEDWGEARRRLTHVFDR
jgi:CHAD domain